jgi:hypothetical protein
MSTFPAPNHSSIDGDGTWEEIYSELKERMSNTLRDLQEQDIDWVGWGVLGGVIICGYNWVLLNVLE